LAASKLDDRLNGQISASNQLRTSSELALNMFGASSELASVMEFGFNPWAGSARLDVVRQLSCPVASSSTTVRRTRLSTVGDRAFPVAGARTWNGPPQHVTSAPSPPVLRAPLQWRPASTRCPCRDYEVPG